MKKILIGSPVKQKNNILREFLVSLNEIEKKDMEIHFLFIDDNNDEKSSELLATFQNQTANVVVKKADEFISDKNIEYECDSSGHIWKTSLIERIIMFKNYIIDKSLEMDVDYLFLIDSDIVLHPSTIAHLIGRNVDIVSNIFWTRWAVGGRLYPQVWLQDMNSYYINNWDKSYNVLELRQFENDFITNLKIPGIYEVGGLGACTLLSKNAISSGVNFSLLDNVSFWGEDRHFCIRARALGLKLYVDTVYPAYHIYREEYLSGIEEFKSKGFNYNMFEKYEENIQVIKKQTNYGAFKNTLRTCYLRLRKKIFSKKRTFKDESTITLSMVVKNEASRYIKEVLESAIKYVDNVVIIDDNSSDNTVELCENILQNIRHKIIVNKESMFKNEYKLRKKQWKETLKTNPDWILFLDADEIFETKFAKYSRILKENKDVDLYCFKLYDMWDSENYRDDEYWNAHTRFMPFMLRYQPKFNYKFKKTKQHCGRMPKNIYLLDHANVDIRIKHMGWSRKEDRIKKYNRYMELDGRGKFGNILQYKSILDENPNLKRFIDED